LNLKGNELITIDGLDNHLQPRSTLKMIIKRSNGTFDTIPLLCRIDTLEELEYFRNGGIMQYVLRKLVA
jgi:aconitate hydratase